MSCEGSGQIVQTSDLPPRRPVWYTAENDRRRMGRIGCLNGRHRRLPVAVAVAIALGLAAIAFVVSEYGPPRTRPSLELRFLDARAAPDGTRQLRFKVSNPGSRAAFIPGPLFVDSISETTFGIHGEVPQVKVQPSAEMEVTARLFIEMEEANPWRIRIPFSTDLISVRLALLAKEAAKRSKWAEKIISVSFRAFTADHTATSDWIGGGPRPDHHVEPSPSSGLGKG